MTRAVAVVGYDGAELLDIACITSTFSMANRLSPDGPVYDVRVVSRGGRAVRCDPGLSLEAAGAVERLRGPLDTIIVSGGVGHDAAAADAVLVAHVRRLAGVSRRVASVCTGASVLAATGLLDGRSATTHWRFAADLAVRYPRVTVDPAPLYVRDGPVATAAGVTSALDLTLAFVEEDLGADLARAVSRDLVTYLHRPGNQAQMSVFTTAPPPRNDVLRRVLDHIDADPAAVTGTRELAALAGVSTRQLARLFDDHLGVSPARHVRRVRTAAAAIMLETTRLPLAAVAQRCGLGTTENLRQAFASQYGITPSAYRSAAIGRVGA